MKVQRLEWLEVMRGLAACWVLIHHAALSAGHFAGWSTDGPWGRFLANGYFGVDFFFVLSGFIIAFATDRLLRRGGGAKDYFQARLVRIYVPYLPVGIAMYLLYFLLPEVSEGGRSPGIITSVTLVPTNAPPALSVAWTLIHEMIFYVVFSLCFISRKLLRATLVLWVIAICSAWFMDWQLERGWQYVLSPLNLCFLLGVLIHAVTSRTQLLGRWPLLLASAGGTLVLFSAWQPTPDRLWVAIGFGLLVLAAASPASGRYVPARFLVMLGAASYSIYLVHNPLLSVFARVAVKVGLTGGNALVAISAVALLGGLLYWRVYERNALGVIRRWIASRKGSSDIVVSASAKPDVRA